MITSYWWAGGSILAALICIPSWPFLFQTDKVEWRPIEDEATSETSSSSVVETPIVQTKVEGKLSASKGGSKR